MSIVVINAITVAEDGRADFEERFAARAGKVSGSPGFEAFELLKSAPDGRYLVYTRWATEEDFKGWMKSAQFSQAHAQHAERGPLNAESEVWQFEVLEAEYGAREATVTRVILDVDTGTDDAIAIMLAALDPRLELVAVTTVAGNTSIDHTTDNTLRVLDHIGREAPVYRGAAGALLPSTRRWRATRSGAGRSTATRSTLPAAHSQAQKLDAARFLVDAFDEGSDTVLVPTGPLTNVATALLLDPGLAARIPRVVLMGGSHARANVTPSAEFNIWADPEAARIVLRSGIRDLTIVPLDATHQALVSEEDCDRLAALGTPAGTAAAAIIRTRIEGYELVQPTGQRPLGACPRCRLRRPPDRSRRDRGSRRLRRRGAERRAHAGPHRRGLPPDPSDASERQVGLRRRSRPFPRAAARGVRLARVSGELRAMAREQRRRM